MLQLPCSLLLVITIDIERRKNRLLKFCYVPATSTAHNRLLFLLQPFTVLMKQTRQAVRDIKQSIFLDVYGYHAPRFGTVRTTFSRFWLEKIWGPFLR
jgi:hypothetical protein